MEEPAGSDARPHAGAASSGDVSVGDEVELEVERVAHGGVFVASLGGRVVFVADTLPGERVRARISEADHPRFLRAEALEVLVASPDRRQHVWGAAAIERPPEERAGGAEFGHITAERQRTLKTTVLRDALRRTGGFDEAAVDALAPEVGAVPGEADGTRSRTRVRLHVDDLGRIGPYAARTRQVVPVTDLPLGVPDLERLLPTAPPGPVSGAAGVRMRPAVELVAPGTGPAFVLGARGTNPPIEERVGERRFALEAGGFWQVHPAAPVVLTEAVRAAARRGALDPDAPNLDLYGGVGLLGAALADAAAGPLRLTTVESDRRASRHAADNLAGIGRIRAVAARVEAYLRSEARPRGADRATVVLDPPRSGAGAQVIDALAARGPATIVYVACDPVALARDLDLLRPHGYEPVTLRAFDLFPNTHHLEVVATIVRG